MSLVENARIIIAGEQGGQGRERGMAAQEEDGLTDYVKFLKAKEAPELMQGFGPLWFPERLFPFQRSLCDWMIRKGRVAVFADCGLGKSPMELTWLENCVRHCNRPALLLTPLAVGPQMVREGEKFGIVCKQSRDGTVHRGITVTNYEQLEKFRPQDFCAVAADESSILKCYDGKTRRAVTEFMQKVKCRLLATATPAPNDWVELGTSSEALGAMTHWRMLGTFFTNGGEQTQDWFLKGHAKKRFWRWVCTWARALRKPSDLGFSDDGFVLPKLNVKQHLVASGKPRRGFGVAGAKTLQEQRNERKATLRQRCEKVAELVRGKDYSLVWCHLNPEGDLLEELIPDAVQVSGNDKDEVKEERLAAFAAGQIRCLITKPRIGGFGLNLQHCAHMTLFPSHSWEQFYQCVRRCWRFGQRREVQVDIVSSPAECLVLNNMQAKDRAASEMFDSLVREMSGHQTGKRSMLPRKPITLPDWLGGMVPCR